MNFLDKWIKGFTKEYSSEDYFYAKKAEYATILMHYLLLAIGIITFLELNIVGQAYFQYESTIGIIIGFGLMLWLIRKKHLELSINLLIFAGFIRFFTIYFHPTPFQFYVMCLLNVVTVAVIHVKRYQCYWIYIGVFLMLAGKIPVMSRLVSTGEVHWRAYTQSIYALVLYIIFILMTEFIIELIHNEIKNSQKLVNNANTDHLTGVLNRRAFWEAHNDSSFYSNEYAIILMDIDHFKLVNDSLGHAEGDHVLVSLSTLLKEKTKSYGQLFRWGGEEFLIFIPDVMSEEAVLKAENLRLAIESSKLSDKMTITASFGVADNNGIRSLDDVISKADKAMYQSKIEGRNRVSRFRLEEVV